MESKMVKAACTITEARSEFLQALTETIEAAPREHQRRLLNALKEFHPELGGASAVHGDAAALLEDIIDALEGGC
jgi:hypothetical protein